MKWLAYASLAVSIASMVFVAVLAVQVNTYLRSGNRSTTATTTTFQPVHVNGSLITPPASLPDAPPILARQAFGSRLTNINVALNATELAAINNASDSYFETAASMFLNHTLSSTVGTTTYAAPAFIVNGKPTRAHRVVVAAGAWSKRVFASIGHPLPLAPYRFDTYH